MLLPGLNYRRINSERRDEPIIALTSRK